METQTASTRGQYDIAATAAQVLRERVPLAPRVAIILGTGLGPLADIIADPVYVPYADIAGFPQATVAGHTGRFVAGTLEGVPVIAMQGRFHLYEGYSAAEVVLPARAMRLLGADTLVVTNAAGGLDPAQRAGDLMIISDHIGLPTMAGLNPLRGPNDERLGPRFPPMTDAYDTHLRALAQQAATESGLSVREGVYAMVAGPNYETPAELRFLRAAGASAVGMSTVPEVIAARHMGMRVLAISCITNVALGSADEAPAPGHDEVMTVAALAAGRLSGLVRAVLRQL